MRAQLETEQQIQIPLALWQCLHAKGTPVFCNTSESLTFRFIFFSKFCRVGREKPVFILGFSTFHLSSHCVPYPKVFLSVVWNKGLTSQKWLKHVNSSFADWELWFKTWPICTKLERFVKSTYTFLMDKYKITYFISVIALFRWTMQMISSSFKNEHAFPR